MEQSSKILWPRQVKNATGGAERTARNVLGEPDGMVYVLVPNRTATFEMFRGGRQYPPLVELLGADKVFDGDSVTQVDCANALDRLVIADVVAFERNGGEPAPGGGWERCDFTFADGARSVSVSWIEGAGAPRDGHVVGNGSIRGSDYKKYFGVMSGDPIPDSEVISFLLFTLPELSMDNPNFFTVTVRGQPTPAAPEPPELFAQALHTVVQVLTLAGRAQEAKQPAQEVVQVYRKLATAPGANRAEIAQNLLALTSTLSSAGLNDEAAAARRAAEEVLRPSVGISTTNREGAGP
jgi:hypothetical protein